MPKKERQSILCPNCRKLISINESHCPFCHTSRPGSWFKNNIWIQGLQSPELMIRAIIFLNVGMYIISLLLNPRAIGISSNPLNLLSPHYLVLQLIGATGTVPINFYHKWWSLLSANYFHGGILHLFFNMFAFRQLAPLIVKEYGTYRMVIIYTFGGVMGFVSSYLAGIEFTLGASAAVCGLIGSILYFGKSRGGLYGQAVYKQIGGWAMMIIIIGFLVPNIDNWAHGGGILGGICLGYILGYRERKRETILHKLLAAFCASATMLVLIWTVIIGIFMKF